MNSIKELENIMKTNAKIEALRAGHFVTAILTNDYNRYKNISNAGNAILSTEEVQNLITNK